MRRGRCVLSGTVCVCVCVSRREEESESSSCIDEQSCKIHGHDTTVKGREVRKDERGRGVGLEGDEEERMEDNVGGKKQRKRSGRRRKSVRRTERDQKCKRRADSSESLAAGEAGAEENRKPHCRTQQCVNVLHFSSDAMFFYSKTDNDDFVGAEADESK